MEKYIKKGDVWYKLKKILNDKGEETGFEELLLPNPPTLGLSETDEAILNTASNVEYALALKEIEMGLI